MIRNRISNNMFTSLSYLPTVINLVGPHYHDCAMSNICVSQVLGMVRKRQKKK